jgi:hypothetical protein
MAIAIAIASVISVGFFALPVSQVAALPAPGTQSDTIVNVQQGQDFVIRTTIQFTVANTGGVFALSVAWDGPTRWDNYTIDNDNGLGLYAYWTSGGSGVGNPVENVDFTSGPTLSGWSAGASIDATNKNYYDGTFNVDVWLKAANQGAPHKVALENNISYGAGIAITEGGAPQIFSEDNVAINTTAWTGGVIVTGTANAYTIDKTNPPVEMVSYPIGSNPPVIAATSVGSGKVIAANIAPALRNGTSGFDDVGNANRLLPQLLDTIIQWAAPGATQIAWSNAPGMFVYSAELPPLHVTDNMALLWGYNVVQDNRAVDVINTAGFTMEDNSSNAIQVFVIPEYEPGSYTTGGDPTAVPDNWVADLSTWVNSGGVLIVIECADYSTTSWNRVQNKILDGVGSNWDMNNDSMYNDNDNYQGNYHEYVELPSGTAIGDTFNSASTGYGTNWVGMYSPSTLVPAPITYSSNLVVTPPITQTTDNTGTVINTFTVTEYNTSSINDTFTMNLSQDLPWALTWQPLTPVTMAHQVDNDAMVRLTSPATNYGSAYTENLGSAVDNREVFLRFDLSAIPAASINSAYLIMSFYPALTAANQMWADVLAVSDDSWTESGITWATMPATGALIDTENLVRAPGPAGSPSAGSYYTTWDVTSYVQAQFALDNVASMCVRAADNTDNTSRQAVFDSREYSTATYRPYLVVNYNPLNYTSITVDVPAGGSVVKTFTVQAPAGVASGTQDNISITSTDFYDNLTESAAAHVLAFYGYSVDENIIPPGPAEAQNTQTVTTTVRVYNTGANVDSENLSVTDDASPSWNPTLSTYILDNTPGLSYVDVTLTVTIPGNAAVGSTDNISVTVVSDGNPLSTVTKIFQVTVGLPASVSIEILPGENTTAHASTVGNTLVNPAYTYDPLTLAVKITNTCILDDKYLLTVTDNTGGQLGLKLTPDEVFVPAGDSVYVALSVTIPSSWVGGQQGTIIVTATGQLAAINEQPIHAENSTSVVVTAGTVTGVAKNIMPDTLEPQTGAPGSPLVWLIALKNTGNVPEELSLSLSESLTGVSSASAPRSSWGATLDNDIWSVDVGQTVITYLRVTVPSDAKTSEWDTISLSASDGVGDWDNEYVKAHVVQPGPRIPEGVIEIAVEAQVVAIESWPSTYDFGVLDQAKNATTLLSPDTFTVRNTGNVLENILVRGSDAKSMPGEPVTTWTLGAAPGINVYEMTLNKPAPQVLTTSDVLTWINMAPGTEQTFGLTIYTPTAITTPARMWARVYLTAVAP